MGNAVAKIIKAISLKKCHSSCCDIEIQGRDTPPQSPRDTSFDIEQALEKLKLKKKEDLITEIYGLPP